MTTLNIQLPLSDKKYTFLADDNIFQSVIYETVLDYIEQKEDLETRKKILLDKDIQAINSKIEKKLWKL